MLSFLILCSLLFKSAAAENSRILEPAALAHHVSHFNEMEDENVTNAISNSESWSWMQKEIPLFECPDSEVEAMYYFRWWSFRKHLVRTTNGWVITEFLTPVSHAGAFNSISCAAAFHTAEGRWLHDSRYLDDYIQFWARGNNGQPQPHFHKFSSWFADAVYNRYLLLSNRDFTVSLLDDLVADYRAWESQKLTTNGLFWQFDVRDGMEESISGSRTNKNLRPTINSYMFANARAIAQIAVLSGNQPVATEFVGKAARLKKLVQENLWNNDAQFFEVRRGDNGMFTDVREAIGFVPWMFELPDSSRGFESAWSQLTDPHGFSAPFGITTAERRHPQFRSHGIGTCEWDGAVWPFATSQTLYALANVLRSSQPDSRNTNHVSRSTYFETFLTYVHSQHANGKPYIGEYLDEVTGNWINGKNGRSRYYNHSTFADLLITGVIGLRPRADNVVEVHPLLPADAWDWFCLDDVRYHGRKLTILWDKDGSRYHRGAGLRILVDGKEIANSASLQPTKGKLP